MGCDIHSVAQVRKNGKWTSLVADVGGDDQNYNTFAVLADVRNGHGFAGSPTGDAWPVIAQPRGTPDDFPMDGTDHTAISDGDGDPVWMGDHSHSWLTLAEMLEFWKRISGTLYTKIGVVTRADYDAIKAGTLDRPKEWCSWKSGGAVIIVSSEDADRGLPSTDVQMSWKIPAEDCLASFQKYIAALSALAMKENVEPHDVRLVFGFDN